MSLSDKDKVNEKNRYFFIKEKFTVMVISNIELNFNDNDMFSINIELNSCKWYTAVAGC